MIAYVIHATINIESEQLKRKVTWSFFSFFCTLFIINTDKINHADVIDVYIFDMHMKHIDINALIISELKKSHNFYSYSWCFLSLFKCKCLI